MEYTITAKVTISTYTTVVADSEEEAIKIASERDQKMSFINNSGLEEDEQWTIDEIDGSPFDLAIEE